MKPHKLCVILILFLLFTVTENVWATPRSRPKPVDVGGGYEIYRGYCIRDKNSSPHNEYQIPGMRGDISSEYDFDLSYVYLRYKIYDNELQMQKTLYVVFDKGLGEMSEAMTLAKFQQLEHVAGKTIEWKEFEWAKGNNLGMVIIILGMCFCYYVLPILFVVVVLFGIIRTAIYGFNMLRKSTSEHTSPKDAP